MKKILLLLPLLIFACLTLTAQEDTEISMRDLLLQKSYPGDSIAEAALMNDIGTSYFEPDNSGNLMLHYERKMIMKIYKKAGLKWGEIEIPFYYAKEGIEEVNDIEGKTYYLENDIVKSTPLAINNRYEEKINENWKRIKFAMPNLKEGSAFMVSYKIISPFNFNLRSWDFQYRIPIKYSEYSTRMNPFYEYIFILQNTKKLNGYNSYVDDDHGHSFAGIDYKDKVYQFAMADVPAFRDETFISSANDYMYKLNFQLAAVHYPTGGIHKIMSTWDNLSQEMLSSDGIGSFLSGAEKQAAKIIDTMQFKTTDVREKTRIIERYVKDNFTWNNTLSKYTKSKLPDFMSSHHGNSAEINLFLTAMLRAAKISAMPMLISTRGYGKIYSDYPFLHFFNDLITLVRLNDEEIALDATDPLSNFAEIPSYCYNDQGLILDKKGTTWVPFGDKHFSGTSYLFDLTPDPVKHNVAGKVRVETSGYDALRLRDLYLTDEKRFRKEVVSQSYKLNDTLSTRNIKQLDQNLEVSYNADIPMGYIGNKIIIAPFCYMTFGDNPLKQPSRTYPIDMNYRNGKSYSATIHIPSGYKLLTKPESLTLTNRAGNLTYTVEMTDEKTLVVKGKYEFSKAVFKAEEYTDLKEFFNKIIEKFNERIVCIKGEESDNMVKRIIKTNSIPSTKVRAKVKRVPANALGVIL